MLRSKKLYLAWVTLIVVFLSVQILLFWFQGSIQSVRHTQSVSKRKSLTSNHVLYQAVKYQRSCSDLFGVHQLEKLHGLNNNCDCLEHSLLNWISCNIGDISIDSSKIFGSVGGEPIYSVMNRKEEVEFLNFTSGSLIIRRPLCDKLKKMSLDPFMMSFLNSAILTGKEIERKNSRGQATLLVRRPTYANPCHALISMYNVYIVAEHLLGSLSSIKNIFWLDGHAHQDLDFIWKRLFQIEPIHVKKISDEKKIFENAIVVNTISAIGDDGLGLYGWEGDPSCINKTVSSNRPCISSTLLLFRNFVLGRYGIQPKGGSSETCQLTFLVRKDYIAHPRSNGNTDRTIANLEDDVAYIRSEYPSCTVTIVSFEAMAFEEQLKIISQSDVLVAVHGAGNIHVLFLPFHALLVEYFPKGFYRRRRFQYISECLNISYQSKKAWVIKTFPDNKITVRLRPLT